MLKWPSSISVNGESYILVNVCALLGTQPPPLVLCPVAKMSFMIQTTELEKGLQDTILL